MLSSVSTNTLIKILVAAFVGVTISLGFLWILPRLPWPADHPIYRALGIRKPVIIGFQPYWLLSRNDKSYVPFTTETTYFGLGLDSDGTVVKMVNPREEEPGWTTLKGSKLGERMTADRQAGLALSLLIHASNEASISALLTDPKTHAQNLLADVGPLMKQYQFADLNLDIESFTYASPSAQAAFHEFVSAVYQGVKTQKLGTLTVELTPAALVNTNLIDAKLLAGSADRIVLMAYDFHYTGSELAGPVAPIGGAGHNREYDVETSVKEALKVIPAEKILLGIPLYGYQWETLSASPGAAVIPGSGATASQRRVEELLSDCVGCVTGIEPEGQQPYLLLPTTPAGYMEQIYYEDETSLAKKLELARQYRLGGVALWALGYEGKDFLGPLATYKQGFYWGK